jgi:hypothetical protein
MFGRSRDELHVERWRKRMLERHHRDATLRAIRGAGFNWRRLAGGVAVTLSATAIALAFGFLAVTLQRCSGQL